MIEIKDINRILVVDLGGIGDLLLAQPALRALRAQYPHTVIDALVVGRCAGPVRAFGLCDQVYILERNLFRLLSVLGVLRRNRYDLVINMRTMNTRLSAFKMFLLFSSIGGRIPAGRDTNKMGFFLAVKVPETEPGSKYEMEYDIDTVAAIGAQVSDRTIRFDPGQEAVDKIDGILRSSGIGAEDILIGIHPGGKPSHRWPSGNFARTLTILNSVPGRKFIITGSRDEAGIAGRILAQSGVAAVDLAGKLTVEELAAVLKRCGLYITNDTGSMHIAAIMGTPLIALFGPGDLTRYDPRRISGNAVVLYKKAPCAPCNRMVCALAKCLGSITVEEAAAEAERLLQRHKKGERGK